MAVVLTVAEVAARALRLGMRDEGREGVEHVFAAGARVLVLLLLHVGAEMVRELTWLFKGRADEELVIGQ